MKPMNFPERKRQRQLVALGLRQPVSEKGNSNAVELLKLQAAVALGNLRDVRTKKFRGTAKPTFKPAA
jgi:hypothetical protein